MRPFQQVFSVGPSETPVAFGISFCIEGEGVFCPFPYLSCHGSAFFYFRFRGVSKGPPSLVLKVSEDYDGMSC